MYLPQHFQESDPAALHALMRDHPLATVVVHHGDAMSADHVPLLLRSDPGGLGVLQGHVARANPLWSKASEGLDCLVIFHGVTGYISPSGYATKAEHGKVVPTWNYEVVHVQGKLRARDDAAWLRGFLNTLTQTHEAKQTHPWQVSDAPDEYITRMMQAVVGIEIEVLEIVGKAKLSQNQPEVNQRSLVQSLQAQGDAASLAMAQAVQTRMTHKG
jgi:transcriptional regulator